MWFLNLWWRAMSTSTHPGPRGCVWYGWMSFERHCVLPGFEVCRSGDAWCVLRGILPEWSKGADLRSARRQSAWVQTPQVPCYASAWRTLVTCESSRSKDTHADARLCLLPFCSPTLPPSASLHTPCMPLSLPADAELEITICD